MPEATSQTKTNGVDPLRTSKCTIRFGGLVAVNELDMSVRQGEIYGLIGPNGAGKTTIFNLLTGVYEPTSGELYFQGQRIDGLKPYEISRRGISRTFQNITTFSQHVGAGKRYDSVSQACATKCARRCFANPSIRER